MKRRVRTYLLVAGLVTHLVIALSGVAVLAADLHHPIGAPPGSPTKAVAASPVATPPPLPKACRVVYTMRDRWENGFTADLVLTNDGPRTDGWTLTYRVSPGLRVVTGWNGKWSQQGLEVTVRNETWNANLETSAIVNGGLTASFDRPGYSPTAFTFNGVRCT